MQCYTLLRNGLHNNMIFHRFSDPDNMEIVILRKHSLLATFPRPRLHTHKPEIMELLQTSKGLLLEECLRGPWIQSRLDGPSRIV